MIALIMLTFVALILIWAWRRLGRQSPEEQLLLSQMLRDSEEGMALVEEPESSSELDSSTEEEPEKIARVSEQLLAWRKRLAEGEADPALRALITDLLRLGERRLLAKAVILFPEEIPKLLPKAGALASAKFELAKFLKSAEPASLPSDEFFLEKLNRYALSASLISQPDTDLIRSLHDEFGVTALVELLSALPGRYSALLFALAPEVMQYEAVELLDPQQRAEIAEQLIRSNRMDLLETEYLLAVLAALRASEAIPAPPRQGRVSDRGTEFKATATLSILLPTLSSEARAMLIQETLRRLNGSLPGWIKSTLYAEMLLKLEEETRRDLLLEIDVKLLSAWLRVQSAAAREYLLEDAPRSLRAILLSSPTPISPEEHYALVNDGRVALSAALQRRLLEAEIPFQTLLV